MARDFKTSVYKKTVGITLQQLEWVKENKGKKSAAGFLELIIKNYQDENRKSE